MAGMVTPASTPQLATQRRLGHGQWAADPVHCRLLVAEGVAELGVVHYVQAPPADVKSVAGVGYVVAESTKQYSRHRKFGYWGEIVIFLIRFAL